MSVRLAACEPCRRAKSGCDHGKPICDRCRGRGLSASCTYRRRAFERKATNHARTSTGLDGHIASPASQPSQTPARFQYPNPGFLGPSSHATIFDQVSSNVRHDHHDDDNGVLPHSGSENASAQFTPRSVANDFVLTQATQRWLDLLIQTNITSLKHLVQLWMERGVSLPLAGPFVVPCMEAIEKAVDQIKHSDLENMDSRTRATEFAKKLTDNTVNTLTITQTSMAVDLLSQMVGDQLRWESLCTFVLAAARAVLDTRFYPLLYSDERARSKLIKLLTDAADCCLEACIGLDRLNDLQLVLQYESFIVHSQVYGDQSYLCWRKMGDLTSSLFALGYHEDLGLNNTSVSSFITELRKATLARIYSADKNLALFLGRPARIPKAFCDLHLPKFTPELQENTNHNSSAQPPLSCDRPAGVNEIHLNVDQSQNRPAKIDYIADTHCSAVFASVKEDIIALFRGQPPIDLATRTSSIRAEAETQWGLLPHNFKRGTVSILGQSSPFEHDFLIGTRLDYLHTLLLLHLASSRHTLQSDKTLLDVAGEMLSLVVEAIVLRDRLVNSGTCLIWKVAHFGLPAAGIVSLALLDSSTFTRSGQALTRAQLLQNLGVLATEVRLGAVVQPGEPNFALLNRATSTIQSLLNNIMGGSLVALNTQRRSIDPDLQHESNTDRNEQWGSWIGANPWDFEIEFWNNLAEHPALQLMEYDVH